MAWLKRSQVFFNKVLEEQDGEKIYVDIGVGLCDTDG